MTGLIEQFVATQLIAVTQRVAAIEKRFADIDGTISDRLRAIVRTLAEHSEETTVQVATISKQAQTSAVKVVEFETLVGKLGQQIDGLSVTTQATQRALADHIEQYTAAMEAGYSSLSRKDSVPVSQSSPALRQSISATDLKAGRKMSMPAASLIEQNPACPTCGAKDATTRKRGRLTVCNSCDPAHNMTQ